ncbi:cytidylyltransferase family-domain-containing protein [Ochromonadaceae sp. CCMP2298]|nr:cytidylyltransferase family-domain-containing protein [Ochromonadaceae sp. CCMP2298]
MKSPASLAFWQVLLLLACCAQRGSALVSPLARTSPRVGLVAYNPVFRRTCLRCTSSTAPSPVAGEVQKGPSNLTLRWITGLSLGAVGTAVIAAGAPVLSPVFLFASYIMREEYYNMVRATGVKTAKNGILAAFLCFATATFYPSLHQMVIPLYTTGLMCFLLATKNRSPSISEISTSIMGVLYLGYMPSFWVRVRAIGDPSFALPTMQTMLNPRLWSTGACLMWWTFTSIVFADVGAYFVGKKFGKEKLATISRAAGLASPNKTVQGALGGFLFCSALSTLGAYLMQWPLWKLAGPVYGLLIGVIGLVGDLTASMLKRDAGFKDSGNSLPGHGGLIDRFDSYLLSAPVSFFFFTYLSPLIAKAAAASWMPACLL